jgi:hypothetical protein
MMPAESLEKLDLREVHFRVSGPMEGLKPYCGISRPFVQQAEREQFSSYTACRFHPRCRLLIALMDAPGAMNSAIEASTFGVWIFTVLAIRIDTPK